MASNKVFDDFYRKKEFIQGRLAERYKKVLNMANWTEEEIKEM